MIQLLTNAAATDTSTAYPVNTADQNLVSITGGLCAVTTLTVTTPANLETVTIGTVVYTFMDTLTPAGVANEVFVGASPAISLDNLKSAVNGTAGAGTTYGTGTVANPDVIATTNGATTQVFEAILPGTAGNAIVSTETGATMAFTSTVFGSGTQTATGSTVVIESSPDGGTTWATELSLANPTMGTVVGSTHLARIGVTTRIRARVTVYATSTKLSATLQSFRAGNPIH